MKCPQGSSTTGPHNILANVSQSRPIDYIVIMEIVREVNEVAYIIKNTFTKIETPDFYL
jgi:hypothetical protein